MNTKKAIFLILKGIIYALPFIAIALCFLNPNRTGKWFFTFFIVYFIFERSWEAFYTSKRQIRIASEIDPTLPITLSLYILLVGFCLVEFYLINRKLDLFISFSAFSIYIVALILRLWAITSLGDQWSINILDKSTIDFRKKLITKGPYKHMRHPIYLGVILEQGCMPLMANLYYTAFSILAISIPFHIIKAKIEERNLISELGVSYEQYLRRTPWINFAVAITMGRSKSSEKSGMDSSL